MSRKLEALGEMLGIQNLDFKQRTELGRFLYFWRQDKPVQLVLDVYELFGWDEPYDPPGWGKATIEGDVVVNHLLGYGDLAEHEGCCTNFKTGAITTTEEPPTTDAA